MDVYTTAMPLFLRSQHPQKRDKLILGGALMHARPRLITHKKLLPLKRLPIQRRRPSLVKKKTPIRKGKPVRRRSVVRALGKATTKAVKRKATRTIRRAATKAATHAVKKHVSTALGVRPRKPVKSRASSMLGQAQRALSQLAQSRQVQRAATRTGRQLLSATPLLTHRRQKRPLDVEEEEEEEEQAPVAKHARLASTHSPIGYRGKPIHRGAGTKQTGKRTLF